MKLTQRQETFCITYFKCGNATQAAITAGYKPKAARVMGSENLIKPAITSRLAELRGKVETKAIMDVQERKERLTEIARARLTDYMQLGADGSWVDIGKETPNGASIQEIHSRTEYDENGEHPTIYTSVKLHDPMKAIDLLNKMDKLYTDGPTVNVDNRKMEIIVTSEKSKKLVQRIMLGEGT
jgi:phage terminase small subunit